MAKVLQSEEGLGLRLRALVVFEDDKTRESAEETCSCLRPDSVNSGWHEVSWCSFEALQQPPLASEAAKKACDADLLVFATQANGVLPPAIITWIEKWLDQRGDREGVLVGLMDPGTDSEGRVSVKHVYLRNVAHRGGMDYLTHLPESVPGGIPESADWFNDRAGQVTHLLDEILHVQSGAAPQGWQVAARQI